MHHERGNRIRGRIKGLQTQLFTQTNRFRRTKREDPTQLRGETCLILIDLHPLRIPKEPTGWNGKRRLQRKPSTCSEHNCNAP